MLSKHTVRACALVVSCGAGTSVANAQSRGTQRGVEAPADNGTEQFVQGVRAYEAQDYARALTLFQDVYVRTQLAPVLFNIGMTQTQLHHPAEAARAFRQYLTRVPAANNRADVERRIATLDAEVAEQQRAEAEQARLRANAGASSGPPAAAVTTRTVRPTAALVVAGVGVASLGTSLALALLRNAAIGNCAASGDTLYCPTAADAMRAQSHVGLSIGADVTFGIGLAALTGGVLWYVLGARTERVNVAIDATPTSAGIRIAGSL